MLVGYVRVSKSDGSQTIEPQRDALMVELDASFPQYGFARHKGYCTPEHQEAIRLHGPCALHRSYTYVRQLTGAYTPSFYGLLEELDSATGTAALDEALAAASDLPADERHKLMVLANRRRRGLGARPRRRHVGSGGR